MITHGVQDSDEGGRSGSVDGNTEGFAAGWTECFWRGPRVEWDGLYHRLGTAGEPSHYNLAGLFVGLVS